MSRNIRFYRADGNTAENPPDPEPDEGNHDRQRQEPFDVRLRNELSNLDGPWGIENSEVSSDDSDDFDWPASRNYSTMFRRREDNVQANPYQFDWVRQFNKNSMTQEELDLVDEIARLPSSRDDMAEYNRFLREHMRPGRTLSATDPLYILLERLAHLRADSWLKVIYYNEDCFKKIRGFAVLFNNAVMDRIRFPDEISKYLLTNHYTYYNDFYW